MMVVDAKQIEKQLNDTKIIPVKKLVESNYRCLSESNINHLMISIHSFCDNVKDIC